LLFLVRKAFCTKKFGGSFGTVVAFSAYSFLPLNVFGGICDIMASQGIWYRGGDTDIGIALATVLASTIYWIAAFLGIGRAEADKAHNSTQ
jgi:hypothetical protein